MKSLLTMFLLLSTYFSYSQEVSKIKPEYLDIIYLIGEGDKMSKLDKALAKAEIHQTGGAFSAQKTKVKQHHLYILVTKTQSL